MDEALEDLRKETQELLASKEELTVEERLVLAQAIIKLQQCLIIVTKREKSHKRATNDVVDMTIALE